MEFTLDRYNVSVSIYNKKNVMPLIVINSYKKEFDNLKINSSFILVEVSNIDWNSDMTPWKYKNFSGNADRYLNILENKIMKEVLNKLNNIKISSYILIGYSLSGLFSLYAASKSKLFNKFGSVSGSIWYRNFSSYFEKYNYKDKTFYLSLGDKEKFSKNNDLKKVEDETLKIYKFLKENNKVYFEFNNGGHFNNEKERIIKCIEYLTEN